LGHEASAVSNAASRARLSLHRPTSTLVRLPASILPALQTANALARLPRSSASMYKQRFTHSENLHKKAASLSNLLSRQVNWWIKRLERGLYEASKVIRHVSYLLHFPLFGSAPEGISSPCLRRSVSVDRCCCAQMLPHFHLVSTA